jgi:hypothetical protein
MQPFDLKTEASMLPVSISFAFHIKHSCNNSQDKYPAGKSKPKRDLYAPQNVGSVSCLQAAAAPSVSGSLALSKVTSPIVAFSTYS